MVDLLTGLMVVDGGEVRLSTMELALLDYLAQHERTVPRQELLEEVWSYSSQAYSRAPDDTMRRLRSKVEQNARAPRHLVTVHGEGYRFVPLAPVRSDRTLSSSRPPLDYGAFQVDLDGRVVAWKNGGEERLLSNEHAVLEALATRLGETVSRLELLEAIRGAGVGRNERSVDTAVRSLRAKIEVDAVKPRFLVNMRGQGYRLVPPPPPVLPGNPGDVVGRQNELGELQRLLARRGATSVVGPGGVGKTTLASCHAAAASRRRDVDWVGFCDLSACTTVDDLTRALARCLGRGAVLGDDPVATLGAALKDRGRALLILDCFERLVPEGSPVVERLGSLAPSARLLLTSRLSLQLDSGQELRLGPLSNVDAVRLFRLRATRHATGDDSLLSDLVDRLERSPLAIELAASRSALLAPSEMLELLDERLQILAAPGRGPKRHATIWDSIRWSWDLLSPTQQDALAACSLFETPFRVKEFGAVAALGTGEALDVLQALLDHSLVVPHQGADPDQRLFRCLDSIRAFAAEQLANSGQGVPARARFVAAMIARGDGLKSVDNRLGTAESARDLTGLLPDLVAAAQYSEDPVTSAQLVSQLAMLHSMNGEPERSEKLIRQALADLPGGNVELDCMLRHDLAISLLNRHVRLDDVWSLLTAGRDRAQAHGDPRLLYFINNAFGYYWMRKGDAPAALQCINDALHAAQQLDDPWGMVAAAQLNIGTLTGYDGRVAEGLRWSRRALESLGPEGRCRLRGTIMFNIGNLELQREHFASAEFHLRGAAEFSRQGGQPMNVHKCRARLGLIAWVSGRAEEGDRLMEQAARGLADLGHRALAAMFTSNRGLMRLLDGHPAEAEHLLRSSLGQLREPAERGMALSFLAVCAGLDGRSVEAVALLDEADALAKVGGGHGIVARIIRSGLEGGDVVEPRNEMERWQTLATRQARVVAALLRSRVLPA